MPIHPFQELDASGMPRHQMFGGMTLRQYYAGLAMQAIIANPKATELGRAILCQGAVEFADALLAELERGKESA